MAARDDYDTALQAAATAIGNSDWATARSQLNQAAVHLARIPAQGYEAAGSFTERAIDDIAKLREIVNAAERRASKFEVHSQWVP